MKRGKHIAMAMRRLSFGTRFFLVFALVLGTITANANFNRANALTVTQGACTATVDSTGGVSVYESGQFCYVAFKTTGVTYTYTPPTGVTNFNILTVAGGGSGGARHSGGGGAGGLLQLKGQAVSGNLTISIGAGGAAIPAQSAGVGLHGNNGTNSSVSGGGITTQTAIGGGYGGYNESGSSGGSGGGSSCCSSTTGGTGTSGQGFAGGYGSNGSPYNAGGGGGAGEAGKNLTLVNAQSAGAGGAGLAISWLPTTASTSLGVGQVSGSSTYFAGGGGGGSASGTGGAGGLGGGTAGGSAASAVVDATANTGGGGGGSGLSAGNAAPASGAGGSGVVVLSYAKPQTADTALSVNGTSGNYAVAATAQVIPNNAIFTVEAWARPDASANYAKIFSQGDLIAGQTGQRQWDNSFYVEQNAGKISIVQFAATAYRLNCGTFQVGSWIHVAVVYKKPGLECYLNGVLTASDATKTLNAIGTKFTVGTFSPDPLAAGCTWNGAIDEVRVFSTARSAAEISTDLRTYGPVNTTGLTSYYDFNEGSGTAASNQASGADSATDLTFTGSPTWSNVATSATSGNNTVVTFLRSYLNNSGGWATPANVTTVQALIIGGGGGGGDSSTTSTGGSGGAGGYFASSAVPLSGRISIGVGTGGSGALTTSTNGTSGGDSWLGSLKVGGGGYGNSYGFTSAQAAGAGGGGSTYVTGGNGGGGRAKQSTVNASMNGGAGGAIAASGVTFGGTTFTGLAGVAGATSGADVNSGAWGGSITEANRTSSISGSSVVYAQSGTYYPWGHASNTLNPQTYGSGGATNYVYGATEVAPNTLGGNGAQGIVVVSYQSTFTVTYNSLGGSAVTAGSFSLGGNVASAPTNPIRTGYTFGGWVTASDGSGTAITFPYTPASNADLTLYAKWTPVAQSVDYALTLPGVSSGAVNTATILPSTSAFTLETWIKPDAVTTSNANAVIVSQGTSDISRFYLKRVTNALASNGHIIYLRDGATGEGDCGYAPPDVWTHIAVTYSGSGSTTCYLNGSSQSSITGSASLTSRFVVGDYSRLSGTNNMWKGAIDELRVYNVARSAPEIAADLQTYGPTNTSSLLAYYDFNEGTGAVASNQKSAADTTYDLTFTGSPTWTDVASTTTSGASTVVTFNRSYLNNSGGWAAPASGKALNYLVIGGGGGGGSAIATAHGAGGGGAGGYRTNLPGASSGANSSAEATFTSSGGFYGVKVGVGGSRQKTWSGVSTPATPAGKGGDSTFATITALGGGGGADYYGNTATSGGSGGGGSISNSSARYSGASGTANQGFAGASAQTGIYDMHGGGGGGAGSIGVAGSSSGPGAGGAGVSSTITGSSVVRASGGTGGSGTTSTAATSGAANTGNGGGGGNAVSNVVGSAGDGGSGVVIVSYRSAFAITYTAGSGSGSSPTSPLTVGLANSFITPANTFNRSGYTFAGWSNGTSVFQAGDRYPASGNVTQDVTLTATWIPSTATINFDSNGGSSLSTSSAAYGSGISKPADPTKANKYFGGWSTSEASNQGDVANRVSWPYTPGAADTTLYAIWNDDQSINFAGTSATSARKVGATGSEVRIVPHDSSFTWEAWIYPTGFAGTGPTKWASIIDNADDGNNYGRAFMYAMTATSRNNYLSTGYWVDANNGLALDAPSDSIALNTWQHVAMTVERTGAAEGSCNGVGSVTIKLFVNGIQVATGTDSSFVGCLNSKGLVIGDNIDDPNQQFKGKIDQVKIWNGVLTASEVGSSRAAYSTTGVDNILRAHYSFNESNKTPTLNDVIDNVASALPDYDLQFYGADGTAVLNNISWTQNLFQVAFNGNSSTSGSVSSSTNLAPFSTISIPGAGNLLKSGYNFNGWNTAVNLSGTSYAENDSYAVLFGDATLYTKWSASLNTVTFKSNYSGGATDTTQSITTDVATSLTGNPFSRTGYTFNGWNTASDGSGTDYTNSQSVTLTGSLTLFAKWTANNNTVTFISNFASGPADASQSITSGTATALRTNSFSRNGYTFAGWNTLADGTGTAYTAGQSVTIYAALTLYAQWTEIHFTVTYNVNSGTGTPERSTAVYGISTGALTLPAVGSMTRTGYKFEGWSTTTSGSALTGTYTPTSDITLYAVWSAKTYAITYFDTSKTSGAAPSAGSYVTGGSAATVAAAGSLARSGYTFAGWNTAIDGTGTSYAAGDSLTTSAPVNLYPKWTAVNYTVTYTGLNKTSGSAPSDATNYNIGNNAVVKANTGSLVRTGYTFAGWVINGDTSGTIYASGDTYTFGASGVTLDPTWTANTYNITYRANGATGGTLARTTDTYTTAGATISLPTRGTMTKTGYTFAGWATAANGTPLSGSSATAFTTASDVTLYAIWDLNNYAITYNRGALEAISLTGSHVATFPSNTTADYNSSLTLGVNPTDVSSTAIVNGHTYKFFGWSDGNSIYNPGQSYLVGASAPTLTAQWIRLYEVRYALNGGSGVLDVDSDDCDAVTYLCTDAQVIHLNTAPSKSGYTFAGWMDQSGATLSAGAAATLSANSYMYYAQWTANEYNISFDSIGGSIAPTTQVKNIGNAVTLPSPGTRTGYDFTGWTLGGVTYGEGTTFTVGTSHAAFTALWTAKRYNVSYDWNGGVGSPTAPHTYTYGTAAITLPTGAGHTKDGYLFDGWALTAGGAKLAATDIPTSDVQYVARWIDGAYAITYDAVNGSTATTVNVTRATSTTLPTPTRTGYSFDGWYSDTAYTSLFGAAGASVSPTSTKTVYGKWTQNSLVGINPAHLNMRGSVIADASTNGTISATHSASGTGATVTVPAGALPTGTVVQLSFVEDLTRPKNLINNSFAYFTSAVLHWQSGSGATATVPSAATGKPLVLTMTNPDIRSGAQIYKIVKGVATLVATATQDGSVSISIYDDPEIVIAATTPLAPMSVTAVGNLNAKSTVSWTAPTSSGGTAITSYTVTASPGGASCTSTTTSCVVQGLNNDTNYTFTVKATNAVGDSVASSASNSVMPRAVPTFNAVFNSKGGSTVADSLFTQPGTLSEPSAPTRTGYTFAGWLSQDGVTSSLVTFPYSPGVNSDVTLYAHWTANAPTGGSPSTSGPINTVTPVTSLPTTDTTTKTPLINVPEAPSLYTAPQSQFTELRNAPYPTNGLNVPASGEVIALVNREPVIVKVTPKENETLIEFGKDLSVTLKSTALDGKPVAVTNGVLTVLKGAYIAANGHGFKAGSPVEAWMYSNPIRLGDGIANADGSFENTFNLPTDAPLGKHTVVLNGLAPDSKIVTLALGVQVIEKVTAPQTNDELQNKSPESIIQNALAIASWFAIAIVLWLFILRRRRERKH